jgi:hypothetical protein
VLWKTDISNTVLKHSKGKLTPNNYQERCRPCQFSRREQCSYVIATEFPKLPPNSGNRTGIMLALWKVSMRTITPCTPEVLQSQITRLAVICGYLVHNFDRKFLLATAHEVFWTLVEVEDKEADEKQEKHQTAHREKKIPPTHV